MTARSDLLGQVADALGNREVIWSGLRGDDVEPLRDLPQLRYAYSIIGEYQGRSDVQSIAYEQLTGRRVDPEIWDIDDHHDADATHEFRRGLLRSLSAPSALLPYRPSNFLSAVHFARRDRCLMLGLFGAHQSVFEHKPFVESAVGDMGLPHIPWTYVADEDQLTARELVAAGDLVLRRSRTSGGEGFVRVDSSAQVAERWPTGLESFVSVAPYIADAVPVNVGAVVWRNAPADDCVTVHHPSVQLIGIPSLVTRRFGYCGNDFGAARELSPATLDQIEQSTKRIGIWLRAHGYFGSFGVDFLVKDDIALFTEVNPRFQGSTVASCRLSIRAEATCLMLEHLASCLGLSKVAQLPVRELARGVSDYANVVVHWTGDEPRALSPALLQRELLAGVDPQARADCMVPAGVLNEPGSLVARFTVQRRMTLTGYDVVTPLESALTRWRSIEGVQ